MPFPLSLSGYIPSTCAQSTPSPCLGDGAGILWVSDRSPRPLKKKTVATVLDEASFSPDQENMAQGMLSLDSSHSIVNHSGCFYLEMPLTTFCVCAVHFLKASHSPDMNMEEAFTPSPTVTTPVDATTILKTLCRRKTDSIRPAWSL